MSPPTRDSLDLPAGRGEIVHFPPLPQIPAPPEGPTDPRQARVARLTPPPAPSSRGPAQLGGPNLSRGYRASAVDVGALQTLIEQGLVRFDGERLKARWDRDVRNWIGTVIVKWVQRLKSLKLVLVEDAVQIEMETQDDRGYYHYRFDVVPGRKG